MNRNSTIYKILTTAVALMLVATLVTGVPQVKDDTTLEDTTGVQSAEAIAPILVFGVGAAIGGLVSGGATYYLMGSEDLNETEIAEADAQETHAYLYDKSSTFAQGDDVHQDAIENHLQDTEETALMIGKNAYIRSLNNGSSQAQAENDAKSAVADYYSERELQLYARWELGIETVWSLIRTVDNESELDKSEVLEHIPDEPVVKEQRSYTLVNGSSTDVVVLNQTEATGRSHAIYASQGMSYDDRYTTEVVFEIKPPTTDFDKVYFLNFEVYEGKLNDISQQHSSVISEIETFVANTYDDYQVGEIDNGDLIDPYLGNREYSPRQNYDNWALRSLQAANYSSPQNLSNFGHMVIERDDGSNITGILMSDGVPDSGSFEIGVQYNTNNLEGVQYVLQEDNELELTGNFTILEAETNDGDPITGEVPYRQTNYHTTNLDEYQSLMDELREFTAEANARQEQSRDSSGGLGGLIPGDGLSWFSVGGIPGFVVLLGGFVALLLITRSG